MNLPRVLQRVWRERGLTQEGLSGPLTITRTMMI